MVEDDKTLSPMRKYHYLKLSLVGAAAATISHLPMDALNYPLAWKALEETYVNKRLLASAYLNQILTFKPIQGKVCPEALKSFLMKINDSVSAFKLLKLPDESSFILFHIAVRCLDPSTRERFELAHKGITYPKFDDLIKFVKDQCNALQLASMLDKPDASLPKEVRSNKFIRKSKPNTSFATSLITNTKDLHSRPKSNAPFNSSLCIVCQAANHPLLSCKIFADSPIHQRLEFMKKFTGCMNCLSQRHQTEACASKFLCKWCKQKHNSAICNNQGSSCSTGYSSVPPPLTSLPGPSAVGSALSTSSNHSQVLLGTALCQIRDARGQYQTVRLVIDSGSHYSFITQRLLRKLGLEASSCSRRIFGIGQSTFDGSKGQVDCSLRPTNHASPNLSTTALVVKEITTFLPTVSLPYHQWSQYLVYPLADPKFFESSPVDFLLGADLFADIWAGSAITLDDHLPKIFPTIFGHVIVGRYIAHNQCEGTSLLAVSPPDDLIADLRKFWEVEEPTRSQTNTRNPEEIACEQHFHDNYSRKDDGSFIVSLPFKQDPPDISSVSTIARRRFLNLEEKLKKLPQVKEKYHEFMHDCIKLGHMSLSEPSSSIKYTIPHHSVVKDDRNKVKLRVVFDASAKTSLGSLNDYLMTGPKLQNDIKDILLNFRLHPIVFVADIVHFYRSIWLDPPDQQYQTIFWRFLSSDAVQTYQLHTLTYGMSCSPFLACAVTRELCEIYKTEFPIASAVLSRDTYIDDTTTGAETLIDALHLQEQLISLLAKGGFQLSKWASNEPKLLENVSEVSESLPINLTTKEDLTIKILGLQWDSGSDCFMYTISRPAQAVSKRSILSAVARIYDPLGLISPYVILLKSFIQELWKNGLNWDQPLPLALIHQWLKTVEDIETIGKLRIPRFACIEKPYSYQLVGFCDASSIAYAAAIYIRVIKHSEIKVKLLTAKTRLAPLRTLTIPRLELCGAYLLSELFSSLSGFVSQITEPCMESCFFTDSSIVLSWLNTPSYRLKTYVSNRVNMITEKIPPSSWRHVDTSQNPADVASRGLTPRELLDHEVWWTGPDWLASPEQQWPQSAFTLHSELELPEVKSTAVVLIASNFDHVNRFKKFIARFSSYMRLLRVVARLLRFSKRARGLPFSVGPLLYSEINEGLLRIIKFIQLHYFFDGQIHNTSSTMTRFIKLNPFMDTRGILRAGGRLFHATLPYNHRHPILLPPDCHFTEIMVDYFHQVCMHPGPSLLQAVIQTRFWVPSLRRIVQKRTFLCKKCYEFSSKAKEAVVPIMANLPPSRLQGIRAFVKVGCDFMGPLQLKESLRRKAAVSKAYVCLFVCMATKAIHLELVSALSGDAFLAAFDRFVGRRGLPTDVYSDCGTNFVAAASHLKEMWNWYQKTDTQNHISDYATQKGIQWHFNPPRSPHFGGLWEAGVKSMKRLLRKAVGDCAITFEEMATLLIRIEAVLNSRPLCPLSSDPSECDYLSPGHFLIGSSLLAPPEPSLLDVQLNRLDRWQLIQRISQYFWHRWRIEYLSTLQTRSKWTKDAPNLQPGDLVILKEDNVPMLHWPMGRIEKIHPGYDGQVRVATVRTSNSTYKRPVIKLIPLLPLSSKPYSESS